MARCTPRIEVSTDPPPHPGGSVRGVVAVEVDSDVEAQGISVELFWRTHGRGTIDRGSVGTARLPGGVWTAGREVRVPFELPLPAAGPVTTRGTLVNIDWYVNAKVDLPWALDPKCETDVLVEPDGAPPLFRDSAAGGAAPVAIKATNLGCLLGITAFCLPFYGGAVAWLAPVFAAFGSGKPAAVLVAVPFSLIGGLMFAAVPTVILYKVWHAYLGHRFLAGAMLALEQTQADAGDELRVRFEVPNNPARVEAVAAELVCSERARYRSGTTTHTARHERHKAPIAMHREGTAWRGRVGIPADAATTVVTTNNAIEWSVVLKATVKGAPDPTFTEPLDVRGRGGRGNG